MARNLEKDHLWKCIFTNLHQDYHHHQQQQHNHHQFHHNIINNLVRNHINSSYIFEKGLNTAEHLSSYVRIYQYFPVNNLPGRSTTSIITTQVHKYNFNIKTLCLRITLHTSLFGECWWLHYNNYFTIFTLLS